ncbi:MAG TPA: hypothetical protein VFT04_13120 [Gemmatimonadales bacterium]|nr:hypothetical protein [Gemmatimonadales bacterium]
MRHAAVAWALAVGLGCAAGTEPEDTAQVEEVAIRLRVEVEEPRLVRRQTAAAAIEGAEARTGFASAYVDSLMCVAE